VAQHYKDLVAWQKAMDLVVDVYKVRWRLSAPGNLQSFRPDPTSCGFGFQQHCRRAGAFQTSRILALPAPRIRFSGRGRNSDKHCLAIGVCFRSWSETSFGACPWGRPHS